MKPTERELDDLRWLLRQRLDALTVGEVKEAIRLLGWMDSPSAKEATEARQLMVKLLLPDSCLDLFRRDTELREAWGAAREQVEAGFLQGPRWSSYEEWRASRGKP
jgi:hypothetical protein